MILNFNAANLEPYTIQQSGLYGTWVTNVLATTDEIIDKLDDLQALVVLNIGLTRQLLRCCKTNTVAIKESREFLYSAIRDLRRELLRGDWGRITDDRDRLSGDRLNRGRET